MKMLSAAGYKVSGCDVDEECVRLSRRYGRVDKIDIKEISQNTLDDTFDCIIMSHVLEHVENPKAILEHVAGLSDGLLVISVPNPYYTPYVLKSLLRLKVGYVNEKHLYSWDWYHFKTFAEMGCGLELIDYCYDSVALPIPYRTRAFLGNMGWLKPLEYGFLRAIIPRFCTSITAVLRNKD
ncbi:bifunctional 3-demethylubiquinone-9 3-methyltransferase/ 2-octaprenyl-6-hydroxy phenol methylase [bacterium BMS3Abin01]|nr:bifunctional 3-demethylubiquinone-9 3-methyltransferase/ 2-octaprenyl-6-hydroxy phenol methylase [bacterium BMS3Abin01]